MYKDPLSNGFLLLLSNCPKGKKCLDNTPPPHVDKHANARLRKGTTPGRSSGSAELLLDRPGKQAVAGWETKTVVVNIYIYIYIYLCIHIRSPFGEGYIEYVIYIYIRDPPFCERASATAGSFFIFNKLRQ